MIPGFLRCYETDLATIHSMTHVHLAVGEHQCYHFGLGAPPVEVDFSGWIESDVRWKLTDLASDPWPCHFLRMGRSVHRFCFASPRSFSPGFFRSPGSQPRVPMKVDFRRNNQVSGTGNAPLQKWLPTFQGKRNLGPQASVCEE